MAKSPTPRRRPAAAKPYHHGDLRRVLIEAALKLAENPELRRSYLGH